MAGPSSFSPEPGIAGAATNLGSSLSTPAEKSIFFLFIFLDTDPHLASVCVISISFPFRDMSCVCVWELVYVCACVHKFGVATNHGKFKVWLGTYV
jgi:hypothetical protein